MRILIQSCPDCGYAYREQTVPTADFIGPIKEPYIVYGDERFETLSLSREVGQQNDKYIICPKCGTVLSANKAETIC